MSDILVGSVAVDIVPDTTKFRRDLEAKVQGISVDIGINADTEKLRAQLDDVTRPREVQVTANADTAGAGTQLDEVARNRTAKINASVNKGSLISAAQGLSNLSAAAVVLGPALIPIAATLGVIGAALAAPIAVAAGGATVFGFIAGFAIKQTEEQKKKIDELAKAVDTAKQSLASTKASAATSAANSLQSAQASAAASLKAARIALANATTAAGRRAAQQRIDAAETALSARRAGIQASQSASVVAAQRKVTDAVAAYQLALHSLTPAQKTFLAAQDNLKDAFHKLIVTAGPEILGPVTKALNVLSGILPSLTPVIGAVSDALTTLLQGIGKAADSPGFKHIVDVFSRQLTPDIVTFGKIAGHIFEGLGGLTLTFGKHLGVHVLDSLDNLSQKFADFGTSAGKSKALQGFFDYFHRVGPQVGDTIGAVAQAIGHVVRALAPLGPPALKVITGIADQISGIPIPVLTALAAAFAAITVAAKVSKGVGALSSLLGGGSRLTGGGAASGLIGSVKPVPVFVTNAGFGGGTGGGGNGAPIVTGAGTAAETAAAQAEAAKAAKAAAAAVKAAGGDVAAQSSAAGRAFKEALAARDAAALKEVLNFGVKGGLRGILGTLLAAPAGITLGDAGNEQKQLTPFTKTELAQMFKEQFAGGGTPNAAQLKAFGFTAAQARTLLDIPQLNSTTSHVDALKASVAKASREIELIGPKADIALGRASRDVVDFTKKWNAIHDKTVRLIIEREIDRVKGPGGGIGHPGDTFLPTPAKPNSGSGSGAGSGGVNIHVDKIEAHDYNDFLRQSQNRLISRGNGGVLLGAGV